MWLDRWASRHSSIAIRQRWCGMLYRWRLLELPRSQSCSIRFLRQSSSSSISRPRVVPIFIQCLILHASRESYRVGRTRRLECEIGNFVKCSVSCPPGMQKVGSPKTPIFKTWRHPCQGKTVKVKFVYNRLTGENGGRPNQIWHHLQKSTRRAWLLLV